MNPFAGLSDVELIFLVLAGLYLWESQLWLRGDGACFVANFGLHRPARALIPLRNASGRLVTTNLFPSGSALICQPWPIPLDQEGLDVPHWEDAEPVVAGATPVRRVSYDAVRSVEYREHRLYIDGAPVAALASDRFAAGVVSQIQKLKRGAARGRGRRIEKILDGAFDAAAAARKIDELRRGTRFLRAACSALFVGVFLLGPLVYFAIHPRWPAILWPYVASLSAIWLTVIYRFWRVRRKSEFGGRRGVAGEVAMICLSPAAAMRAGDALSRHWVCEFHPLAVAVAVCSQGTVTRLAEQVLRDARCRARATHENAVAETWYFEQLISRALKLAQSVGLDPARLLADPPREPDCQAYCPRCLAQFVVDEGRCPECAATLQAFEASSGAAS